LESALFINSFDSKDSNFKKATTSGCHHRGNEEKNRKKNQNQNPILYIHFNVGGNDKKKEKASVFGHFDTYKKTVIVSLSHFT